MCSSNPLAGLRAGHRGMKCRENGLTQQRTSLRPHEYLELADCTQAVFSSTVFLFIETFLLPPFCHFWDKSLSTSICESHCLEPIYHKYWEKQGRDLYNQDLSIPNPIACIFPSLLPALTLAVFQDQSILTVLRNVLKLSLGYLLSAWSLESLTFWDWISL